MRIFFGIPGIQMNSIFRYMYLKTAHEKNRTQKTRFSNKSIVKKKLYIFPERSFKIMLESTNFATFKNFSSIALYLPLFMKNS
jgi:hypothetical protein